MNPALLQAHARLAPWFERLPRERHPWWWPAGSGASASDWGLSPESAGVASLALRLGWVPQVGTPADGTSGARAGTPSDRLGSIAGEGRGALPTARTVRYWVLLDAPPARGEENAALDDLPRWIRALGIASCTHVTSVRKFRPSSDGAPLPDEAIVDAAHVLADEARAVLPERVFAGRNARRTLRAVFEVLRDGDDPAAPVIRSLLEVHGREGRMPHERSGRGASLDDATMLLDQWRAALVRM